MSTNVVGLHMFIVVDRLSSSFSVSGLCNIEHGKPCESLNASGWPNAQILSLSPLLLSLSRVPATDLPSRLGSSTPAYLPLDYPAIPC